MAAPFRVYTSDYSDVSKSSYYEKMSHGLVQGTSLPERRYTGERVKTSRVKLQPSLKVEVVPPSKENILTPKSLSRIMVVLVFVCALLVGTVFMTAKATSIKYSINSLQSQNAKLQTEIDALNFKIQSSNSIEGIEAYAIEELGMNYPRENQCIYITTNSENSKNLSEIIKEKAYRE